MRSKRVARGLRELRRVLRLVPGTTVDAPRTLARPASRYARHPPGTRASLESEPVRPLRRAYWAMRGRSTDWVDGVRRREPPGPQPTGRLSRQPRRPRGGLGACHPLVPGTHPANPARTRPAWRAGLPGGRDCPRTGRPGEGPAAADREPDPELVDRQLAPAGWGLEESERGPRYPRGGQGMVPGMVPGWRLPGLPGRGAERVAKGTSSALPPVGVHQERLDPEVHPGPGPAGAPAVHQESRSASYGTRGDRVRAPQGSWADQPGGEHSKNEQDGVSV